jgi:Rieske Fe-S protein
MAGEDQERFEDYLELEHFIEELQAGHVAHPPDTLTPSKASIYRMAALFRSASPEEAEPRPEFAAELQARLEQELQQPTKPQPFPFLSKKPQKKPRLSRRALLTGGAAAAASMVVGVGIGATVEQTTQKQTSNPGNSSKWPTPLVPEGQGVWVTVAKLADLGESAIRFATDSIVGYIIRSDGDNGEKPGAIIAISAACTHMGCIVNWQDTERKYFCPCHGGLFSEYGKPDKASPVNYLTALPRLDTRITKQGTNEVIQVRVPASTGAK